MPPNKPKSNISQTSDQQPHGPADDANSANTVSKVQKERYRVLIEDVADGFYEVDLQGNFRFFNNALCRIFGYSRDEIQNHNFRDFMDENNSRIAYDAFNRIYRTGQGDMDINWEIIRKDGEKRHLEISANLIVNDNNEKIGFRGITRDVTERFLAQKALEESQECALELSHVSRMAEQRYRAFLNFLPDPVFAFNMDSTVSYLNPAFEKVFGWTLEELEGQRIPFVPENMKAQTRAGVKKLFNEKILHGFETKRLTKDGRLLDIVVDGALFYDKNNQPAGQVITLRDVTREKRNIRINEALHRIAQALYQYRRLDDRLQFITREVQDLLGIEGAMVILLDEEKKEFFFREAVFDDLETERKFKEIRYPVDKGIAGEVYRTGKPLIVKDVYEHPNFVRDIDAEAQYRTRSLLDVPLEIQGRMIGVLCAVNKKEGEFDQADVQLLTMIGNLVALPIENASINEELNRSYEEVKSLNRAKDRVIHHLSHELKTPVSILSASLSLLRKRLADIEDRGWDAILQRAERNLSRLLEMQYQIEDILKEGDFKIQHMLVGLLEVCRDELEVLVSDSLGEKDILQRIRAKIDDLFGPKDAISEEVRLDEYVEQKIQELRPRFDHRSCRLETHTVPVRSIWIPVDVLSKIITGLVRNAVENTPDGCNIDVKVREGEIGPEVVISDNGVGISEENQRLIFENYFTVYETMQYSSRNPYDFNAGGKGFDLLRMKIFSERYNFKIQLNSKRCSHIPLDKDVCPGDVDECPHVESEKRCPDQCGTTVTVQFFPAERFSHGDIADKKE